MNKNSNVYTFIYASVMVIIVAAALAFVNGSLKDKQKKNVEIDKMSQILKSVKINSPLSEAEARYGETIVSSYLIDAQGKTVSQDAAEAFALDMSKEVLKPAAERRLPVYEALIDGQKKYIIPLYGAGLWGPIWGYISLESDGNTVYAATFSHEGETPGLGAEITTAKFQEQFSGKHVFQQQQFRSLAVLKAGHKADNQDAVDAISGGTVTSRGVETMLFDCLSAYEAFLKGLQAAPAVEQATENNENEQANVEE
ncbi:MAG: NADH:ubiquinone reductase (Na(+)-transporting) subunit C [Bacteroidales bacterium]|nr:NADH:ubiquinone reductase (Na(+)-transporting) subunit C [Bacteroidales bacterium]